MKVPGILRPTFMKYIIDPRQLLEGMPPSSPIWAIADAFDAATNGMENPEADARLTSIQGPEFKPWKAAIGALKALYADDRASCLRSAISIDADAPPAALVPLFKAWASASGADGETAASAALAEADAAVAELYGQVIVDAHPLAVLAEQAEEALRQGMLDHFERASARILRELHGNRNVDGPLLALRFAAYCLALLDAEGREESDFFSIIVRSLGRADGFLALGLALIDRDDCAAAAALRGALEAGEGAFLQGPMRDLVAETAELLESPPSADQKKEGRERKSSCEDGESIQLELFL